MGISIICCRVLEREVRTVAARIAPDAPLRVMDWGLHVQPDLLLDALTAAIREMEGGVDAVVLGFGRCRTLDKLPTDFRVPVLYPPGEDCIGVLLGQERYLAELYREAGTWFLTPGWAELGMDFIFGEVRAGRYAEKGMDPMAVARRMLKDYTRALLIDTGSTPLPEFRRRAEAIAGTFNWRLETTSGSLERIEAAMAMALSL